MGKRPTEERQAEPRREDDPRGHEQAAENSELARRLRDLQWPTAKPAVKQRVLERVLAQVDVGERSGS